MRCLQILFANIKIFATLIFALQMFVLGLVDDRSDVHLLVTHGICVSLVRMSPHWAASLSPIFNDVLGLQTLGEVFERTLVCSED